MSINKVIFGSDTIMDISDTTAAENKVLSGEVFYNAAGTRSTGSLIPVTSVNGETGDVVLDKGDIGLDNVDNVQQYSASNPPPYPVTSVNGSTGAVITGPFYAVCDTASNTQIKEITVAGITSLVAGLSINVKFVNSNSISRPYLKVNSLDSKPIYEYGTIAVSTTNSTSGWQPGAVVQLTYDGTGWVRDQGYNTNTTYNISHVQCVTSAGTAAKTATCAYYVLNAGNVFVIVMAYSNTKAAALTLSINSTGAKPIYINGTVSSATNYTLPAGTYLCYYDGTNYYLNTDGTSPLPGYVKSVNGLSGAVTIGKSDVGLGNVDNVQQYSASNPPPYPVTSVNGSTGAVTVNVPSAATATPSDLGTAAVGTSTKYAKEDHVHKMPTASDVGALPSSTSIPSKTSDLTNDSGFITSSSVPIAATETPSDLGTATIGTSTKYAREDHVHTKPTYSKSDVGLGSVDNVKQYSASNPPPYPVTSVNGATGAVTVVEDDHKWGGVELAGGGVDTATVAYVPSKSSRGTTGTAYWATVTNTPTNFSIPKYDGNSYLKSTTPPANDNSTKVATTAYVDRAIPTDENLKTTELGDSSAYVLLGPASSTAGNKYYTNGMSFASRSDEYTARLTIGQSGTGTGRRSGQLALYNQNKYCILRNNSTTNSGYYVNLPASGGTLVLTSEVPTKVSDLTNDSAFVDATGAAAAAPVQSVNGSTGAVTITPSGLGITDYVTERGTSGDWEYKKYANGKFEAWGTKVISSKEKEGDLNGWNYTRVYLAPPSFTTAIASATANARWGNGVSWGNIRGASVGTIEIVIFSNQKDTTLYVWYQIWGSYTP